MKGKKKTVSLNRRNILLGGTALVAASSFGQLVPKANAQQALAGRKPNILMIMADDIGWFNVSA